MEKLAWEILLSALSIYQCSKAILVVFLAENGHDLDLDQFHSLPICNYENEELALESDTTIVTSQPLFTASIAKARPIPFEPPVITTCLLTKFLNFLGEPSNNNFNARKADRKTATTEITNWQNTMSQKSLLQFFKRPNENSDSLSSNKPVNEDFDDDMMVNEENNEVDQINLSDEETEQRDENSMKNPIALNRQYGLKRIWLKKFPCLKVASFDKKKVYCDFCKSEKVNTILSSSKILPTWRINTFNYHEQKDEDHAKVVAAMKTRPLNAIKTAAKVAQQKDGEAAIDPSLFQAIITRLCESICFTLHVDESTDITE
uniref:Uncharacterized protein n=1 Tax=Romanomermis culicivorax TaxID=13658 RepID=A0A915J847_ROMCU